ncbi:GntR family transcriptional regulator [Orenia metallireducens]|uniref:GntR family transcriptional regulator n=1 Tax=Orenia metallireducens TaxID=1413210 RepID=A0A1C0AB35_9FIRM|nr:GntR family transcriptional regulator [Orenia metallireducens]OCL27554.1 GntR family transcriptional regulator [Orenia metallireducens]
MKIEELTKKEQIINFARHDPFLKISDIAENVETTPRYVRTILSEANISLMELREKYARNMEQRLAGKESNLQKATVRLLKEDGEVQASEITLQKISGFESQELIKTHPGEELFKITQKKLIDGRPYSLQEVITYLSPDINQERISNLDSLYELFGNKGVEGFKFRSNVVQLERYNPLMATRLGLKEDDPIIKSQRIILIDKMPIGIENFYFDANSIQLVFPGELVV